MAYHAADFARRALNSTITSNAFIVTVCPGAPQHIGHGPRARGRPEGQASMFALGQYLLC